jgi:conjugal transfer/entry exclusion protein
MSIFTYTLPSGATFKLSAPTGTTQLEADLVFYGQVAAGALVGYSPGQTLTSTATAITKFALSRQDRGTAGVDTQAILALVNNVPSTTGVPALVNTPLTNPINQANLVTIAQDQLPATAIGPLGSTQVQGILAQIANLVDQPAHIMTDDKGVGQYGLSCEQLEQAGYVKPNTWRRFIFDPAPLTSVLASPGIWSGKEGIVSAAQFLANPAAQTRAMTSLLQDGYLGLVSGGIITPATTQAITATVGQVYTATNSVVSSLTNTAIGDVGALVTNAGRFGSAATAAWSQATGSLSGITSLLSGNSTAGLTASLSSLTGSFNTAVGSIGQNINSLSNALDISGKAGKFATAFSNPTDALNNLATNAVGQVNVAIASVTGQVTNAIDTVNSQITNVTNTIDKLSNLSTQDLEKIFQGGVGDLVAKVETAAGYTNTVNRGTLDVAFSKILGSSKIPLPAFELPSANSISLNALTDVSAANNILQNLKSQGGTILGQIDQVQNTVTGVVAQAQNLRAQAGGVITNALNSIRVNTA